MCSKILIMIQGFISHFVSYLISLTIESSCSTLYCLQTVRRVDAYRKSLMTKQTSLRNRSLNTCIPVTTCPECLCVCPLLPTSLSKPLSFTLTLSFARTTIKIVGQIPSKSNQASARGSLVVFKKKCRFLSHKYPHRVRKRETFSCAHYSTHICVWKTMYHTYKYAVIQFLCRHTKLN